MYKPSDVLSVLEKDIIELALEDHLRLADITALLRSRLPEKKDEDCITLGIAMLGKLLRLHYIELYEEDDTMHPNPPSFTAIRDDTAADAIADVARWTSAQSAVRRYLAVAATSEAESAMYT
jgi:hypothetical protein